MDLQTGLPTGERCQTLTPHVIASRDSQSQPRVFATTCWTTTHAELRLLQQIHSAANRSPECLYDRLCALALLDSALKQLEAEYTSTGHRGLFLHLVSYLQRDAPRASHAEAAAALDLSPGAVRNAVKPFRDRFRHFLREQISMTVDTEAEVEEELRHLLKTLSQ